VIVPTAFAIRRCPSRPFVLVAAWLVVLQAFLAGFATARTGIELADGSVDVICHGAGSADLGGGPAPHQVWHLCCTYCLSAAPAVTPPDVPGVARPYSGQAARLPAFRSFIVVISPAAIRAGPSQGPPGQA
jgi:hypothetical protein